MFKHLVAIFAYFGQEANIEENLSLDTEFDTDFQWPLNIKWLNSKHFNKHLIKADMVTYMYY